MIKLIVTDLDGTLLDDEKKLPLDFYEVYGELKSKGIQFAVASGRSYSGVESIFGELAKDIFFICDNGAFTVENSQIIDIRLMDKSIIERLLNFAEKIGGVGAMLCGANGTYVAKDSMPSFIEKMKTHYSPVTYVESLYHVQDDIFKLSLWDGGDIVSHSYLPLAEEFGKELTIHMAANVWIDTMDISVDKGVGVKRIQEKLGITQEETMAFGDFYNDIPLLKTASHSFVMANANEDMKQNATHIADDCNHGGVTKAIKEYALIEFE
ncbi:MAG: HAD family hydrolase [Oscillospiraceae bacterium]